MSTPAADNEEALTEAGVLRNSSALLFVFSFSFQEK